MQPRLTVRVTSFPESNGKRNWTALLVRLEPWRGLIGNCGGITIARGELWNRVAYEAECARALLGERDTEPHILDYGDDIQTPEEWAGEVRGGRVIPPSVTWTANSQSQALRDLLAAHAMSASCQAGVVERCMCVTCSTARALKSLGPDVQCEPPEGAA